MKTEPNISFNLTSKQIIGKKENTSSSLYIIKTRLKEALNIILQSQNILINKLNFKSNDIKNLLLKYFINISQKNIAYINIDSIQNNILNLIKLSPIYNYIQYANNIYPLSDKKKLYTLSDFKSLLNKSKKDFTDIYDQKNNDKFNLIFNNIYDQAVLPIFNKNNNISFNNIKSINEYKYFIL